MGEAGFKGATFANGPIAISDVRVLHVDNLDLNKRREWPDVWTVRPDPNDPTSGTLVYRKQAEEPEQAVPPSDPTE
jgi:hypothetical protein